MGGEKIKFIAYAVIVVFIFSILYFTGSVYRDLQSGPARAQIEFTSFAEETSRLMSSDVLPNENYIEKLQDAVLANSRIVATLLSIENEIQFAYPISSNLIAMDTTGMPILQVSSPLLKTFSSEIPTQQGKTVIIKAAVYVLHPQDIYDSARISFLIILACTLIILLLILYITISSKKQYETLISEEIANPYMDTQEESVMETIPIVFRNPDEFSNNFPQHTIKAQEDEIETSTEKKTSTEIEKDIDSENYSENQAEAIISDPMGLFSNTTGLGWESYMETRLDAELVRAASSEQDLALIFIRIKDIEKNTNLLKKVSTILIDYFKFRDFLFEYKKDGFAGILLNMNLDQAMALAENLYTKLLDLITDEGITTKIGIGISTRTLRLIPGSRIIEETDEAVEKSFTENDLPIVAFRVNPEKYRQFVLDPTKSLP